MFELNAVEATVVAAQALAGGQVQAGIFDTIEVLADDAMSAFKAVISLVVVVTAVFLIHRAKWAVAAFVMYALMAGGILWLVWGGTGFFKDEIGDELENASAAPAVTQYELV